MSDKGKRLEMKSSDAWIDVRRRPRRQAPTPCGTRLLLAGCLHAMIAVTACGNTDPENDEASKKPSTQSRTHGLTREQASKLLVRVGDKRITVGEFAQILADQSPYLRARYNSAERRREFLENLVQFELLSQEAKRKGYDRLDEVESTRKQLMVDALLQRDLEQHVKLSDISDKEVEGYYKSHSEDFHKPEQVKIAHVLVGDASLARKVLEQALKPTPEHGFDELVSRYSTDAATQKLKGEIDFFSRPNERRKDEPVVPASLANAAFKIKEAGDVYPEVVRSERGFHVVKLLRKRQPLTRTLDDARRMIQNRLWRDKRQARVQKLADDIRSRVKVRENLALLDKVKVSPDEPPPTKAKPRGDSEHHD